MHIVYVIAPGGGPEAYVQVLLPWLEDRGHRISVVFLSNPARQNPFPSHIRVEYVQIGSLHYYLSRLVGDFHAWPKRLAAWESAWAVYCTVARIHQESPVDVVEITEGMPVDFLRRRWGVVVRAHGSAWTVNHFCQDGVVYQELIRQQTRQFRQAHAVSALSHYLAQHLSEFCGYGLDKIDILPYPIDIGQFSPVGDRACEVKNPALLAIGRLEHRKGTDTLLTAMPFVWEHFPNTHVYLLGNEAQFTKRELLARVAPEKRGQIIFPGFVPRTHLPDFYRAATLYVTPTQFETFGYTILEAMACGLPVVSCSVGAVPELIEHGINGLLTPFGDPVRLAEAIVSLLGNSDLRTEMGQRGRQKALAYSLECVMPRYEALYSKAQSVQQLL